MHKPSDFNHWTYWLRYEWGEWNPYRLYRKIFWFLKNLWAYRSIMWHDRDWDWAYLLELMELKLRRMGDHFNRCHILVSSERSAQECRTAADLCHRIREDAYNWKRHGVEGSAALQKADLEYLCHLLERKLFCWWD